MKLPRKVVWSYEKEKVLKNPNIAGVARRQSQSHDQRKKEWS